MGGEIGAEMLFLVFFRLRERYLSLKKGLKGRFFQFPLFTVRGSCKKPPCLYCNSRGVARTATQGAARASHCVAAEDCKTEWLGSDLDAPDSWSKGARLK